MTAGTLPPGLTLSSAGVISGTATTAGDYTGTVTATNGITPNATQTFNITIADAAVSLIITSAAPGNGTQGAAYSHTYTATGTAPITFAVTAGTLPPGLTLSSAGVISGTATTAGTYVGTVTATNGTAPNATQNFSITIAAVTVPPSITSAAPGNGTQGAAYSHTYTATGTSPITFAVTAGALPPGLTLSSAGVISGTPTTPGTYVGTVTATNGITPDATQNFSITIAAVTVPPSITSAAPGNGTQGVAYSHTYTAAGTSPITFAVTAGTLPPGLTLSSAGVISGTATTPGTYVGTVTATNGITPDATQNFSITIAAVTVPPSITSAAPGNGTQGVAYSHTYTAAGTSPITFAVTAGTLPPGLTLSSAGVISGTATTAGTYVGTVTATNGITPNATQNFSITIAAVTVPPSITSAAPGNGTQGAAYSHTYTATGTSPITFAVTAGALPPGLTLSSAGVISGTATTAGTYVGTVTATNGITPNATQNFSITISAATVPPTITSAAPANGTQGVAYSHTYTATGSGTISYVVSNGTLPPGLTLTTAGVLSGTPTTAGTYTGRVRASNGTSPNATQNFRIIIAAPSVPPTITSAPPPNGTQGVVYSHSYTVTGSGTISYVVSAGALPPGLNLSANGVLSGTPTTAGVYSGVVTASNGTAPNATQSFSITIAAAAVAPSITSLPPVNSTQNSNYLHTYTATGSGTITFTLTSGELPPGLSLSANGVLSGTPNILDEYTGVVTASNGIAPDATQPFSIAIVNSNTPGSGPSLTTLFAHDNRQFSGNMFDVTITNPLRITSFDMNVGWGTTTISVYYRNGSYVGSETNPAAWTLMSSAAVLGEGPNNRTRVAVSSPVLQPGVYGFYVTTIPNFDVMTATDLHYSVGGRTVANDDLSITTGNGVGGMFGDPAACAHPTRAYFLDPCIFPDRTWNGTIYYELSGSGVSSVTSVAPTADAPSITSGSPASGTEAVAYAHSYTATGSGTISYVVSAGELPPGLTLSADGLLSGTPTAAGEYSGEVTASNGTAPDATQPFTITIASAAVAPSITSGAPASGTEGVAYAHSYTATGSGTISYVVSAGTLPPGLALSADGVLSGTPTAGEYSGEVTASNGIAPDATQPFTITIAAAAVAPGITSGAPANGTEGVAYAHSYTATGSGTISYAVSAGELPPGLALSADGVLSGTPTAAGEYSGEVTASSGTAPDATQPFTITIAVPE